MEQIYRQLGVLARQYGARKLVLLVPGPGGDFRERSDIDLAVYGMPPGKSDFLLAGYAGLPEYHLACIRRRAGRPDRRGYR